MTFFLSTTLSYLLLYKYVALFAITYLAAFLFPIPASISLLASGAFASQGYLNLFVVLFVALAGNIFGDLTGFILARLYGKRLLSKIGFRKMIESKQFTGLEKFLNENSGPTIFITRFVGEIGPLVNILSGLSNMSFKKFFLYEATGEFTYVIALGFAGYFLGSNWQNSTTTIELISVGLIIVLVVIIFGRTHFRKLTVIQ